MAGLKQPFSFAKTTCNCCVSEKIPKTNDVIRIPDTDRPVSKQKRDATSTNSSETANVARYSPERIIYFFTDKKGVNWFTEIDKILLKNKSQFSVSLLNWYKSPTKISKPTYRYKVLRGLVRFRRNKVEIYEQYYGILPDSPTYVAQKLDVNRIPKGNQYKSTTVERTTRLKRSGIIKYQHDGTNRNGKSKSVRFVKQKRKRSKTRPSQVPIINGMPVNIYGKL